MVILSIILTYMTTEPKKTGAKNIFIDHLRLIIGAIFVFIIYLLLSMLTPRQRRLS